MDLWKYEGKQVKIIYTDGDVFVGLADICHDANDTASGNAALTCIPFEGTDETMVEIEDYEIASIEILPTATPTMAEAI